MFLKTAITQKGLFLDIKRIGIWVIIPIGAHVIILKIVV
jgi:hypothetical protein